jgi:hypothetical protein
MVLHTAIIWPYQIKNRDDFLAVPLFGCICIQLEGKGSYEVRTLFYLKTRTETPDLLICFVSKIPAE